MYVCTHRHMTYRVLKSHKIKINVIYMELWKQLTRRLLRQWLCGNSYTCGYSCDSCNRTLYAQGSEVHEQGGHVVFMIPYTYICIYVCICIYIYTYVYIYVCMYNIYIINILYRFIILIIYIMYIHNCYYKQDFYKQH